MLKLQIIAVLFLIVIFVCGVRAAQNSQNSQPPGISSPEQPRDANNGVIVNHPEHPVDTASKPYQNASTDSDALSRKDKYDLVLTVALLLAVVGQLVIAWRQNRIADQQRQIMENQIESAAITERAYIGIAELRVGTWKVGEHQTLYVTWVNGGRTPAWRFRCIGTLIFDAEPKRRAGYFLDDDFNDISGSFLPPEAERKAEYLVTELKPITKELISEMNKGTRRVYACLLGSFIDFRGEDRPFTIWALYEPYENKFVEIEPEGEREHNYPKPTKKA